ncbi:MAG: polyprenyl synthetase family protein [Acidobacteriota bacterium]|nr:polyprenyl synthetase family protein [Acidobacteriota bacterium]
MKTKARKEFSEVWRSAAERVDRQLREFLPPNLTDEDVASFLLTQKGEDDPALYTRMISEPAWKLLERGGKRWRPIFGIHLLGALGRDPGPFERLIAVLSELTHTGSLIIDDIQDRSSARRGGACVHLCYGDGPAINAANVLYFMPQLLIMSQSGLTARRKLEIHQILVRQFVRAHFGQARDLDRPAPLTKAALKSLPGRSADVNILRTYELKTAAPIAGLAEVCAVIAGSVPAVRRDCVEFGRALGTAFQIVDDVRDFDRPGKSGRECGKDLGEGKITYAILRALECLRGSARDELIDILTSRTRRSNPADRARGLTLVRRSGALAACRREAEAMVAPVWRTLAARLSSSGHKKFLKQLVAHLMDNPAGIERL